MAISSGGVDLATLGLRLQGGQIVRESGRVDSALGRMGRTGSRVREIMAELGVTLSAGFALRTVIREAGEFEGAMQQALAIMGDVSDTLRGEMVAAARTAGRELNLGATAAAESFFFLASAGLSAEQSIAALPAVAEFAKAGMFSMALATDLATDAQSALGLTVDNTSQNLENLTRVTDVLVKANTLANATVEQFSTALTNEAGAALKTFGKDIEEGVAVLAAFADQGVKGQVAGTGLSRILRLMSSAAIKNATAYEDLGIEVFNQAGEMNNLADIIDDLTVALGGMSDEQRTASLEALGFQARVQGVIQPLLGTADAIREYEVQLRTAGGTTQDVAERQMQAPFERLGRSVEAFKNIAIDAGSNILEILIPAMELAAENADLLADAILSVTVALGVLAAIKIGAVIATSAIVGSILAWLSMAGAIAEVGGALALLQLALGPVGWVVAGATAIGAAFFFWRRAQRAATEETKRANTFLAEQTRLMDEQTDAQLEATRAQLMMNIARLQNRGSIMALDRQDIESLHTFTELLREANAEINRRAQPGEDPAGGVTARRSDRTRQIQLEIDRLNELNEAFRATQREVDLINLAYDERLQLLANAEEFEGAELATLNALTRELFEAKRATVELAEAEEKRQQSAAVQENIVALRREVDAAERFLEAQRESTTAVNELRIALAGENAVLAFGENATKAQATEIRKLAEQKELLRQKTDTLTDAQRREAEAAKKAAETVQGLYEEAARGIQRALADGFAQIQQEGLKGFEEMGNAILNIFQQLASEIAALMVAQALGLDKLIERIRAGQALSRGESAIAGAALGIGAGLGTQDPLLGALGGAAAGFAVGGPVGAGVGAVAGFVSGIIAAGKAAEEARKRMATFQEGIDDFIVSLRLADASELERAQERIRQQLQEFITGFSEAFDTSLQIDFRAGAGIDAWLSQVQRAIDIFTEAQLIVAQAGLEVNAYALEIEALEDIMRAGRIAAEQLEKEYAELIATSMRAFRDNLSLMSAELAFGADSYQAFIIQQRISTSIRREEARALLEAGLITQAMFDEFNELLREDGVQALAEFTKALSETILAATEASRVLVEDFTRRGLSAVGESDLAAQLGLAARQRRELQGAIADEESPAVIELIKGVHELERQTLLEQQQLRAAQEALRIHEESLQAQVEIVDSLRSTEQSLRAFSAGLNLSDFSPLSPLDQLDVARQQFRELAAAARAGDQAAAAELPAAARALLEASREVNASGRGFVVDFNLVQSTLEDIAGQFGAQATIEEQILAELQDQRLILLAQSGFASEAVDEAQALNLSAMEQISLQEALGQITAAEAARLRDEQDSHFLAQLIAIQNTASGIDQFAGFTADQLRDLISDQATFGQLNQNELIRLIAAAGSIEDVQEQFGNLSLAELRDIIASSESAAVAAAGFAGLTIAEIQAVLDEAKRTGDLTDQFGQLSVNELRAIITATNIAAADAHDDQLAALLELVAATNLLTDQLNALLFPPPVTLDLGTTDRIREGYEDFVDSTIGDPDFGHWERDPNTGRRIWVPDDTASSTTTSLEDNIAAIDAASADQVGTMQTGFSAVESRVARVESAVNAMSNNLENAIEELGLISEGRF